MAAPGNALANDREEASVLGRRLDALESRLQRLEAPDATPWLTEQRAAEIRDLVGRVLADAEVRAGLRDDEPWGGWDDEFFLESPDGRFRVEVSGQLQQRLVWNRRSRSGPDETLAGFEVRRAKIKIDGHLFGRDLGYTVGTAHQEATNDFVLQSFNIRYRISPELRVSIGRARPPLLREEEVSSKRQLAVERSLVADAFRQTRTLGVMLRYQTEPIRIAVGFMDGTDTLDGTATIYRVSTRFEARLGGTWEQMDDFTSFPEEPPMLAFGGGVLYQEDDQADPAEPDSRLLRWSLDVALELGGANIFAALIGNHFEEELAAALDQYGFVIQGGVFVNEDWELFARYEYGDAGGADEDLSAVTIGANYYINGHGLKWTTDIGYGFREVGDLWEDDGSGWLEDRSGQDGQVVLRSQLQLLF